MRKLSLQWRLTLMTAVLITAACIILNLMISSSAVIQIDEMKGYMIEITPPGQETVTIDLAGLEVTPDISEQAQEAKDTLRMQSIIATLIVIFASSFATYFSTGRALSPLKKFSERMEKTKAQNLSEPLEIPDTRDEIARLTVSFNDMLKRLDRAFIAQRQFSANAAHELRTPLAVMQTNLDVLQKRGTPTKEEYAGAVQMMLEQTERLSHVVSVLLEMTELESAKQTDQVSLSTLVEEVICDLMQVAEEKDVSLNQGAGDADLFGNDTLLYRAVYNLVENAIKYNRPGGAVTVDVQTEDSMALLCVEDTGIGIAEEKWEQIFEPFMRVDKSRSRAMGGAGLGLALVRDIATLHGGSVRVAESSEAGTKIVLTLPLSREE